MDIDAKFLNSEPVNQLCGMFVTAYTRRSFFAKSGPDAAAMLNAIGACAGFAAQMAVWRALIMPAKLNPGDFLYYAKTNSDEVFIFGEAINQFLLLTKADCLSFLSVAEASLPNTVELPDRGELVRHVSQSVGKDAFGRPRLPPSVILPDMPREALRKIWSKVAQILTAQPAAEWPVMLGCAAFRIRGTDKDAVPLELALKILLEAAVPMSKIDPRTIELGIRNLSLSGWNPRALQPEKQQEIASEVRAAMPVQTPARTAARPLVIAGPRIAFLNLLGTSGEAMLANDNSDFGGLFPGAMRIETRTIPACDVLFVYCAFEPSGIVVGQRMNLRDLIAKSGALMAVVASEVPDEITKSGEFMKSLGAGNHAPINLIITNNRNGGAFGRFFKSIFGMMWAGVSLPMAFVKLAPQGPAAVVDPLHKDVPGTLCIIGAGHIVFEKTAEARAPEAREYDTREEAGRI